MSFSYPFPGPGPGVWGLGPSALLHVVKAAPHLQEHCHQFQLPWPHGSTGSAHTTTYAMWQRAQPLRGWEWP
eukprot:9592230-Karenia_brevis.AAC.1